MYYIKITAFTFICMYLCVYVFVCLYIYYMMLKSHWMMLAAPEGPSCYTLDWNTSRNKVRKTVKQQINKLSLQGLLTIINQWVILLTSVLVVGGHGAVSWDHDSDVLRTHWSVCSFASNYGVAAEYCCVSLCRCSQVVPPLEQHGSFDQITDVYDDVTWRVIILSFSLSVYKDIWFSHILCLLIKAMIQQSTQHTDVRWWTDIVFFANGPLVMFEQQPLRLCVLVSFMITRRS